MTIFHCTACEYGPCMHIDAYGDSPEPTLCPHGTDAEDAVWRKVSKIGLMINVSDEGELCIREEGSE